MILASTSLVFGAGELEFAGRRLLGDESNHFLEALIAQECLHSVKATFQLLVGEASVDRLVTVPTALDCVFTTPGLRDQVMLGSSLGRDATSTKRAGKLSGVCRTKVSPWSE